MKNEVTFQLELKSLQDLIQEKNYTLADEQCSRMLNDYNKFDYELLLKRSRIRQCLMKYEEAALDANIALHVLPQRMEAYYALSDYLIAMNDYGEALKILEVLYNSNPNDPIIKSQYTLIHEKEKKKQIAKILQLKQTALSQKNEKKGQAKSQVSKNTEMKKFMEQQQEQEKERTEAYEMGVSLEELRKRRAQTSKKSKIDEDGIMYLSDELSEDNDSSHDQGNDEEEEQKVSEKPGNQQHLETPSIIQPLDFRSVTFEELYGKKKEVYKMKQKKLALLDCQLCKLIFDYTTACNHYSQMSEVQLEDLKQLAPSIAGSRDINQKKQALQKVTKNLDVLSTFKVTSLTLLSGQFAEILPIYLKRDVSALLGDNSDCICQDCFSVKTDSNQQTKAQISLAQHALIIVNRSLAYQQQAIMLNEREDLINVGGLEEEKADFTFDQRIVNQVIEELRQEIQVSVDKQFNNLNFMNLHYMIRAITNILILVPDQLNVFNTLKQFNLMKRILEILNSQTSDILKDKSVVAPQFCMFVTHSFRFLIMCHAIDSTSITSIEEPSLKQVVRKYELYEKTFQTNKKLFDALKGDILFFKHSSSGCNLKNKYKQPTLFTCIHCNKKGSGMKVCSRCMGVYYCNRECQKGHYPKHKSECKVPSEIQQQQQQQ